MRSVPNETKPLLTFDQRLGARVAFGPRPLPELLDVWREVGYDLLFEADDPKEALIGGLLIRVAELEAKMAERAA